MSRVWFVTGASQGFGKPAVEEVLSRGDLVVAAVRNPSSLDDLAAKHSSDKLLIVKCDVTKLHDITSAFDLAYEKFGRVDVVFNHAGTTIFSEAETEQEELARNLFEVNFWGAVYVMKEAVRAFRERNAPGSGGRLLNMSSAAGFAATPGAAYYTASKHALEGFAETLAKELDPAWNIKITNIEPGAFKTGSHGVRIPLLDVHPAYTNPQLASNIIRMVFGKDSTIKIPFGDPKKAVEKMYEVSQLESPPMWLPLGKDATGRVLDYVAEVEKVVKQYESWSDSLLLEE